MLPLPNRQAWNFFGATTIGRLGGQLGEERELYLRQEKSGPKRPRAFNLGASGPIASRPLVCARRPCACRRQISLIVTARSIVAPEGFEGFEGREREGGSEGAWHCHYCTTAGAKLPSIVSIEIRLETCYSQAPPFRPILLAKMASLHLLASLAPLAPVNPVPSCCLHANTRWLDVRR